MTNEEFNKKLSAKAVELAVKRANEHILSKGKMMTQVQFMQVSALVMGKLKDAEFEGRYKAFIGHACKWLEKRLGMILEVYGKDTVYDVNSGEVISRKELVDEFCREMSGYCDFASNNDKDKED